MSDDALKECPHCGSPAQLEDCRTIWRAICTSAACRALVLGDRAPEPEDGDEYPAGYWEAFEKSAIDRWNARPAIAPPVAAGSVEDLQKFEDHIHLVLYAGRCGYGADAVAVKNMRIWLTAWGAQHREAGRMAEMQSTMNMLQAYADRAEKAEADLKERDFFVDVLNCQVKKAQGEADILFHRLNAANGHLAMARERIEELETEIKVLHRG